MVANPSFEMLQFRGLIVELVRICTNIPELYVVFGTLNSEPSILNRPLA